MANAFVAGQAYDFDVPIFDTSGKIMSGVTFTSAEISKDGNSLTPLVNMPFEIFEGAGTPTPGSGSGLYQVFLLPSETAGVTKRISGKLVSATVGAQDAFFP